MNGSRILVVEDESSIAEIVSLYLRRAGYAVDCVADGEAAIAVLCDKLPDLVILDLMLPKLSGLEITQWLRDRGDTPIIMLTARREVTDRIAGLELGADDYVVKPFSPQELVSRVRAVLRRSRGPEAEAEDDALEYEGIRIEPLSRRVVVEGEDIHLSAKEFDLLWALARHPGMVLNRTQLLDQVWGFTEYVDPSTVTVHVRRLREKIERDPSKPRYVETVWGVGYRFRPLGS